MMKNHLKAKLILEDGSIFNGFSFGHPGSISERLYLTQEWLVILNL